MASRSRANPGDTWGLALALAAIAALCLAGGCRRSGPDWRIVQLYAGETSIGLLKNPAKVQAFRVDPTPRAPKVGDVHAGPFVAAAAPVDLDAAASAELSALLADAESYDWRRGPKREPLRAQAGLWFVRGPYVLEIALDLETAQIGVYAGGQPLGVQSIDPARPRLVEIAQRVFPDDPVIRALK